ncbi:MAG: hypothetical protein IAI50_20995, partial [Candidatus Eremiobacteraeota bacterium]|nr:hypothetical protein [Candidatus Eremiobacteraeota bacterium]
MERNVRSARGVNRGAQCAIIAAFLLLIVLQVQQSWRDPAGADLRHANVARDFKTFYCAGATANAGENPYLQAALERCGNAEKAPLPSFIRNGVWAAPLPPYDIAVFRVLAALPYYAAAQAWFALSI